MITNAATVRYLEDDFLGAYHFPGAERLGGRYISEGEFCAIGPYDSQHLPELLNGTVRRLQIAKDPSHFLVERNQRPRRGVQDDHPHW